MIIARLRKIIMPVVPSEIPRAEPKHYHTAYALQKAWRTRTIALEIMAPPGLITPKPEAGPVQNALSEGPRWGDKRAVLTVEADGWPIWMTGAGWDLSV
jgi:hypothetical protein